MRPVVGADALAERRAMVRRRVTIRARDDRRLTRADYAWGRY